MDSWLEKQIEFAAAEQECGVYVWDLGKNVVVPDRNLAGVFDLPFAVAQHGLPIERYIAKIHPDDQPKVAKALHDAIISGRAYRQEYRLQLAPNKIVRVLSFGQCFPDEDGIASQYVGIVFECIEKSLPSSNEQLLTLCQQAQDYAKDARNETVSNLLELAVLQLTQPQPGAVRQLYAVKD